MDNKKKLYAVQYLGPTRIIEPYLDEPTAGHIELWTMAQILDEINRDRSAHWTPYVKRDWKEGLTEWTSYRPYDMRKIRSKKFVVFALKYDSTDWRRIPVRVYSSKEQFTITEMMGKHGVLEFSRKMSMSNAARYTLTEAIEQAKWMNKHTEISDTPFEVYPCAE